MALAPGLKKRGLFGSQPTIPTTPDIADMVAEPMPAPKPGFFGEGGVGRAIAGNIGDFLLQYSGMNPIYAPAMQQRQQMAYDQQRRQADRLQGFQDWVAKQKWERENRPPTYFDDNAGNRWSIGADGKPTLAFRDPTQKYVQQVVTDPDGSQRLIQVPVPNNVNPDGTFGNATLGGGQSGPAVGTVEDGYRFKGGNPADRNSWEPVGNGAPTMPARANVMRRDEYQMFVSSMGKEAADRWLRGQGIRVEDY